MKPVSRTCGFTLIEALVAVTLLALLLGALMPVFQNGLSVLHRSDRHSRALIIAQSVLDRELAMRREMLREPNAPEGETQGEFEDFNWQLARKEFTPEPSEAEQDNAAQSSFGSSTEEDYPFDLLELSVTVTWPENSIGVALHTLSLEVKK